MRLLVLLALSATAAIAQAPQLPKALASIPVFAGAKSVPTDSADLVPAQFVEMMSGNELKIRSREVVAYEVFAYAEAVYEFYVQRLGGVDSVNLQELNYTRLKPGQTSAVFRGLNTYDINAKQRAALGARPKYEGEFIKGAVFAWATREGNGDITALGFGLHDLGVAADWSSYSPRTRLMLIHTIYVNPGKEAPGLVDVVAKDMVQGMKAAIKEAFTPDSSPRGSRHAVVPCTTPPGAKSARGLCVD